MKTPTAAALVLLAALVALGWHNHRRIADLRKTHRELLAQAAERGIRPGNSVGITKRPRPDRVAEAKRTASEFIAYARDMDALAKGSHSLDKATRQRMIDQMDRIMSLNGKQLEILIDEVLASGDIDEHIRRHLIEFLIRRLTRDYPMDALSVLIDSPGLEELLGGKSGSFGNLVHSAIRRSAETNPEKALAWFRKNRAVLSENAADRAESGLIYGTALSNLPLALDLLDEFGKDPSNVPYIVSQKQMTPEARAAALAPIREWLGGIADEKTRKRIYFGCLVKLALGSAPASAGFKPTTQWLENANLPQDELEFIARPDIVDLSFYIKSEETGQWLEWLGANFPAKVSGRRISQLAERFRTSKAAETWLTTAPDTPAKRAAIRAYVETKISTNPAAAARWARALPEGPEREQLLERIANPHHFETNPEIR